MSKPLVSIVIIGRNEGARLLRCLHSIQQIEYDQFDYEVIYVDSDSTDQSPQQAAQLGAHVVTVHPTRPSAALGRNAGWQIAKGEFIMFLDGDTILHPQFICRAFNAMRDLTVAVVWGHRREACPQQSCYVRVLDLDWIYPAGESEFCGGDAFMRRSVLQQTNGFDASLIAGEEPELCQRIRALGYRILHLDVPMTLHDLAITRFSAYWKRAFRAGHAYAEIATRSRLTQQTLWIQDAKHNLRQGSLLLLAPLWLALGLIYPWFGGLITLLVALLLLRSMQRCAWKHPSLFTRALYALHSQLQHLPIVCGQIAFYKSRWMGKRQALVEYK